MRSYFTIALFTSLLLVILSCKKNDIKSDYREKIILDTDMGSDCDDVGALALLHEYSHSGKVEILGIIYSSGTVPYGAGVIDAINRYYEHENIPIGANYDPEVGDPLDKMSAEKLAKDTSAYKNRIIINADAPEQTILNRTLLSQQSDNSVTYITIGHTRGLYDLLISEPDSISNLAGIELVNKKIKRWIALGALGASNKEGHYVKDWNFFFNNTAKYTKHVVDHFPKPMFFVDGGTNVMTGKSLMNTPKGNIVRTAYRDWLWNVEKKTLNDQRPSWDLAAVYFAVEGAVKYFEILNKGYLDFDVEKGSRWVSGSSTRQNFVAQKENVDKEFADYLNGMISKFRNN